MPNTEEEASSLVPPSSTMCNNRELGCLNDVFTEGEKALDLAVVFCDVTSYRRRGGKTGWIVCVPLGCVWLRIT